MARLAALLFAAAVLAACGSSGSVGIRSASLVLDFTPNAVHAGIYSALARRLDHGHGVRLRVIEPSASTDSIKLLETGAVDFAILDIHDLAIARERGKDLVGIMAIVERPLAALLAAPRFPTPTSLSGHTVGISGLPSDTAVLDSIVQGAGGDPQKLRTVTIGFNAVADLLAGKVSAATAFWNDEGVTLARERPGFHAFRVDHYGAPRYPELVLCATDTTLRRDQSLARDVVSALVAGYGFTVSHPAAAAADLERLVPGLDPALVSAQLTALLPAFTAPDGKVGELGATVLREWAAWEARFRIVTRTPDVSAEFDPAIAAAADSAAGR